MKIGFPSDLEYWTREDISISRFNANDGIDLEMISKVDIDLCKESLKEGGQQLLQKLISVQPLLVQCGKLLRIRISSKVHNIEVIGFK